MPLRWELPKRGMCQDTLALAVVTFTVKDSVSGTPVAGAYVSLICNFAGGGTIPYDGYSDANGVVSIDVNGNVPVLYWSVEKSGYKKAGGSGAPPSTVNLEPITPPPPPPSPNIGSLLLLGAIILGFIYFTKK
jgi:hypothetical protein